MFPKSNTTCRADISDLEKQLSDQTNRLLNLQEMVDDLASKVLIKFLYSNFINNASFI